MYRICYTADHYLCDKMQFAYDLVMRNRLGCVLQSWLYAKQAWLSLEYLHPADAAE